MRFTDAQSTRPEDNQSVVSESAPPQSQQTLNTLMEQAEQNQQALTLLSQEFPKLNLDGRIKHSKACMDALNRFFVLQDQALDTVREKEGRFPGDQENLLAQQQQCKDILGAMVMMHVEESQYENLLYELTDAHRYFTTEPYNRAVRQLENALTPEEVKNIRDAVKTLQPA